MLFATSYPKPIAAGTGQIEPEVLLLHFVAVNFYGYSVCEFSLIGDPNFMGLGFAYIEFKFH
jgi:hypothetical protein